MKDLPDWTSQVIIRYEGGFIGLEELAARLGSIAPYDLRGNIVLMEDFESEETEWVFGSGGTGSTATRSSRHKYSGDWSIKLKAGNEAGAHAETERRLVFPGESKVALFGRLGFDDTQQETTFWLGVWEDGVNYTAEVRYRKATTELAISLTGGAWPVIDATLDLGETYVIFFPVLLVVDLETKKYVKLIIAENEYDLGAYDLYVSTEVVPDKMKVGVDNNAVGATGCAVYVDDIIIAKNVP